MSLDELKHETAVACLRAAKYIEAKNLLIPLVQSKLTERSLVYTALYSMAEIYFQQNLLKKAEEYGILATKGLKRHLGVEDPLYLESTTLVIMVYEALGDQVELDAWKAVLRKQQQTEQLVPIALPRPIGVAPRRRQQRFPADEAPAATSLKFLAPEAINPKVLAPVATNRNLEAIPETRQFNSVHIRAVLPGITVAGKLTNITTTKVCHTFNIEGTSPTNSVQQLISQRLIL